MIFSFSRIRIVESREPIDAVPPLERKRAALESPVARVVAQVARFPRRRRASRAPLKTLERRARGRAEVRPLGLLERRER